MTSVGYGDIVVILIHYIIIQIKKILKLYLQPANEVETIFVTFTMFVACFIFAYSFNSIGLLVEDMNKNEK